MATENLQAMVELPIRISNSTQTQATKETEAITYTGIFHLDWQDISKKKVRGDVILRKEEELKKSFLQRLLNTNISEINTRDIGGDDEMYFGEELIISGEVIRTYRTQLQLLAKNCGWGILNPRLLATLFDPLERQLIGVYKKATA